MQKSMKTLENQGKHIMNQGTLEGFEEYTHPYGISGLQEQATMNLIKASWMARR